MRVCPACHRPFGGAQRTCFACARPILRNHKWHIVGCYIAHDDCQNPTMRLLVELPDDSQQSLPAPGGAEAEPANTGQSPESAMAPDSREGAQRVTERSTREGAHAA